MPDRDDEDDDSRQRYHPNYNRGGDGETADMGSALKEKVCVSDDGKLQVFGKSFDVGGREVAFFLGPLVNTALTYVSLKGASKAGQIGTGIAGKVLEQNNAAKVGKAAYYTWLFGLSTADVVLGLKKTVQDGFKDMHALREQAQPLLAANNDRDVSIGKALTSKSTVLAHARAKVWANFKHNLYGSAAGTIRALPAIMMGYNQARLDTIVNSKSYWNSRFSKGMKEAEDNAALRAKGELTTPPTKAEEENLKALKTLRAEMRDIRKKRVPQDVAEELQKKKEDLYASSLRSNATAPGVKLTSEEERLYNKEAELNLKPEESALLGKLRNTPTEHREQLSLLTELRELEAGGKPRPRYNRYDHEQSSEERKEEVLGALKELRDSPGERLRNELKKIREIKKAHLKDLKSIGSATHEQKENVVTDMFSWGEDPHFKERMFGPVLHPKKNDNYGIDYKKNIQQLKLMPAVASVVGDLVDHKISGKEAPDVAWDKMMALQEYLGRHHHPDRAEVDVDVKKIFRQHVRDLGLKYELSGSAYEEAMTAITDALVNEKLHPQALGNILDNKKVVVFGKDDADFGDLKDVKQQLEILVAQYSKVGNKEVFKNAPFTEETLPRIFRDIPEEEKPFFTMLFPPGVLEKAGVPKEEVAKYRAEGAQNYVEDLADKLRLAIGAGHDELRKQGVKSRYIDAVVALEQGFRTADRDGEAADFIRDNLRDVTRAVRNVETSAKKPGEMWTDFAARSQKQPEDMREKTPMDQALRESGDEVPLRG